MTTPPIVTITDELLAEIEAAADAFPDYEWDSNQAEFFNGPSGESLGGGPTGFYCVYGPPFEIDDDMYDGPTLVEACPLDQARFICEAKPTIKAMLAHIAGMNQQAVEREAHVRNLIDSETLLFNYLADIRQAVGEDGRLMLPGLVEHIRGMSQQLIAAGIAAANCELFRKDAERYAWLRELHNDENGVCWVSVWDKHYSEWVSLDRTYRAGFLVFETPLDLDAAIDAARSAGGGS